MKLLFSLLLSLLTANIAIAQFSDTVNYNVKFTSNGSINRTKDASSYLLNNAVRLGIRKKSVSLNMNSNWIYGQQNKQLTNNDFNSALDFNLYKTLPNFYYWGLGNYTTSLSLKIKNQLQAGAGIAYNFVDKPEAFFNISDGILYETSDVITSDTTSEVFNTFRNSLRISFRYEYKKLIVLSGTGFIQNSLSYKDDYIIKSNLGLAFKLRQWLSLSSTLTYNNVSRTSAENLLFVYGLTIEKYF